MPKKWRLLKLPPRYSGLSTDEWLDNNLMPATSYFWKHLLRGTENGNMTIGRLDSRYTGIDGKAAGDRPDYNSELTSWLHSFTSGHQLLPPRRAELQDRPTV